jgi:hypothetical protein
MKLLGVLIAHSAKATRPVSGNWGYLPDVREAAAKRYRFIGTPTDTEIVSATPKIDAPNSPATPLTFTQGKFQLSGREVTIEQLQIFAAGFLVSTKTHTRNSDAIVDDFLAWSAEKFHLEFEDLKAGSVHGSQIDFRFELPLPELLPVFKGVGPCITERLKNFFEYQPVFELTSIYFWIDKTRYPEHAPHALRIDRRAGIPFEDNIYWSDAPLSTDDHVAVLTEFEEACLAALK